MKTTWRLGLVLAVLTAAFSTAGFAGPPYYLAVINGGDGPISVVVDGAPPVTVNYGPIYKVPISAGGHRISVTRGRAARVDLSSTFTATSAYESAKGGAFWCVYAKGQSVQQLSNQDCGKNVH